MACPSTDVYFLVVPNTMLLDFAGTAESLRVAVEFGAPFRLHWVGPVASPPSSIGLTLGGVSPLPDDLPEHAMVIVSGVVRSAKDHARPEARIAAKWLARVVRPHHLLCTVCSGVFLAARSGLLDGRNCTTHHTVIERLAREYPLINVLENRIFVRDGNIFTSAGVTAGIDLALHLISEFAGAEVALDVARYLVLYFRRSESDCQLSPWLLHRNHIHPIVHRVQDLVIRDPARGWVLADLAARAHVSPRHLVRLFHLYAGVSPLAYVRKIRTAAAKDMLGHSRLSLEQIAETVGFSSAEQMRRAWKRFEGNNPADLRRQAANRPA
jgi:transcriptional regulator GlxA family with amidase domain